MRDVQRICKPEEVLQQMNGGIWGIGNQLIFHPVTQIGAPWLAVVCGRMGHGIYSVSLFILLLI